MRDQAMSESGEEAWNRKIVPRVVEIASSRLSQRDLCSVLLLSTCCYRALISQPSLWKVLDLHEMNKAGERLVSALSLDRYKHVERINLEFASDVHDEHLFLLKNKVTEHLQHLEYLNLNGCQKISDNGIEAVTIACPKLRVFSIFWNVRVTDVSIKHLVKHCKHMSRLNLSGCKGISDQSLHLIGDNYKELEELNITRCIKITDNGLQNALKCSTLKSLNLYALSSLTDRAYEKIGCLADLEFLDLCGAQNLSDNGLSSIASCRKLLSLNLTWCIRVTDVGVMKISKGCRSLEFLSLFGIVGLTDRCLEVLSKHCSNTITTLDVNGCTGIKRRSHEDLRKLFPHIRCFRVHS
ncbi:F-box protein At3g58530 [Phalaenopsis equestris]|uniref:F-box protein At3g58530 n=1 Tax=Phalaenopsis equestris TaxID=78828 RepID=UPI0009E5E45B|nr:F-box protein At3g58530 [Phalaenopsis equestris]